MIKKILTLLLVGVITQSSALGKLIIPETKDILKTLGTNSVQYLDPKDIRVLVWNMYKGDLPEWEEDFKFVRSGHDIIMLQEMFLEDRMTRSFTTHAGFEYHTATSFIYDERKDKHSNKTLKNIRTGVATASNVKASEVSFQRSIPREPIIKTPKMIILTKYPMQGTDKELLTINIHAVNFVTTTMLSQQVLPALKAAQSHNGPVVFGGDFNVWSPGKTRFLKNAMRQFGFEEVTFKPAHDKRMRTLGHILDYVFVRDLKIGYRRIWGELEGADHKAITVHLEYENL